MNNFLPRVAENKGESMSEVERLIEELQQGHWILRQKAARALAKIGAPAVEPLGRMLEHDDAYVRGWAAWALGKIGDTTTVEPLCRRLKDDDADVRKEAAEALGRISRREALPALKARLRPLVGESDSNALAAIHAAIEKIEKATAATKNLPRPASAPMPDTDTLPRPSAALTFEVDKLPRPATTDGTME
jgi:HEAT repeat protein